MRRAARHRAGLVLLTAALACGRADAPRAATGVTVGAPAPAYAAQTLEGTPVALADLKGRVVLLNIWATWCQPCRQEMPALDTLHTRYGGEGLTVVGVSIDEPQTRDRIAGFAQDLGAHYTLWHDPDDRVSSTFLAIGVPASYLIGRDGTLRWKHVGPVTASDGPLTAALTAALAEPGGGEP
jgi:cytochrome c biogenesis protein CcmG/thiol:disulfide interchange protein DsbE